MPAWEKWAESIAADTLAALAEAADAPMLTPSLFSAERRLPLAAVIEDLPANRAELELSIQAITIAADVSWSRFLPSPLAGGRKSFATCCPTGSSSPSAAETVVAELSALLAPLSIAFEDVLIW
jgi:hypothetical protein